MREGMDARNLIPDAPLRRTSFQKDHARTTDENRPHSNPIPAGKYGVHLFPHTSLSETSPNSQLSAETHLLLQSEFSTISSSRSASSSERERSVIEPKSCKVSLKYLHGESIPGTHQERKRGSYNRPIWSKSSPKHFHGGSFIRAYQDRERETSSGSN